MLLVDVGNGQRREREVVGQAEVGESSVRLYVYRRKREMGEEMRETLITQSLQLERRRASGLV